MQENPEAKPMPEGPAIHSSHNTQYDVDANAFRCSNCGRETNRDTEALAEKCTSDLVNDLPGDPFTDPEVPVNPVHPSHKMMGDVCKVCNLNKKQDSELMVHECVRDMSDKPGTHESNVDRIQRLVAEGMAKVTESVHKKFAEMAKVGPDMDPQLKARMLVVRSFNQLRDVTDSVALKLEDTYVVKFSYVLGYHKTLISTTVSDGKYYEVTYNALKKETYVDTYVKLRNEGVSDDDFFAMFDPAQETVKEA